MALLNHGSPQATSAAHSPRRRSPHRQFRNGRRAAAVRAFTGARLYLDKKAPTLIQAAEDCGSNVQYVRAAITVIEDGSPAEHALVLTGDLPLFTAASQARLRRKPERVTVEEAVASWRSWTPEQRLAFGRCAGISEIWDWAISPVITLERAES